MRSAINSCTPRDQLQPEFRVAITSPDVNVLTVVHAGIDEYPSGKRILAVSPVKLLDPLLKKR
jgi:hypothetical protein